MSGLLPLLDSALTDLESLEKKLEASPVPDAKQWPVLSLGIRKLATTSIELVNLPETRNRSNRSQFISFCARLKAIALVLMASVAQAENKPNIPVPFSTTSPAASASNIIAANKKKSTGNSVLPFSTGATKKPVEAVGLPELQKLIQQIATNAEELVSFEWEHETRLGPQGTSAVVESLNWKNTHLSRLCLQNNMLADQGVSHVAKALQTNRTITELDLSGNSVTVTGVSSLVESLTSGPIGPNNALKHLDLSHNLIDFAACGYIARLIVNLYGIEKLFLNNNLINEIGLTTIGNALSLNCTLKCLKLQHNPASQSSSAGPVFATVLANSNYDILNLDLGKSKVSDSEMQLIQTLLSRNSDIHKARLDISQALSTNPTLASEVNSENYAFNDPSFQPFKLYEFQNNVRVHLFHSSGFNATSILKLATMPKPKQIHSLVATNCGLTKLTPQLCLLGTHLETLDLRCNKLTSLPPEIKGLFKLHTVHMAHNFIQHLPYEITMIQTLSTVSLNGNPLQWVPQDVVQHVEMEDRPPQQTSLFKFLQEAYAKTDQADDTLFGKVMILGHVHSGKSSLCQVLEADNGREGSLQTNWINLMPRYTSTEGIQIRQFPIKGSKFGLPSTGNLASPDAIILTKQINFQVWECGGSSIFTASHSIFFRREFLYLLTVDLNKLSPEASSETIAYLKNTIHTIQAMVGAPSRTAMANFSAPYIAIVGTYEDQLTPSAVDDALSLLRNQLNNQVIEVLAVSNKSARGMAILRDRVLLWSHRSNLLVSPQFGSITNVLRVIRSYSTTKSFISRLELEAICKSYGLAKLLPSLDSSEQSNVSTINTSNDKPIKSGYMSISQACNILERMGAIITFNGDATIQNYVFIDPQYVANMFSDIMASSDADGYIYRSHVPPLLWMDCRRQASMRSLFDWCRLFGLALDFGDSHYIIPSLLNSQPSVPLYNAAWPTLEPSEGFAPFKAAAQALSATPSSYSWANSPHSSKLSTSHSTPTGRNLKSILIPSVPKDYKGNERESSYFKTMEWPVLVRGLCTDFVPLLVFSHIMTKCFSLPGITRSAWWRNGFIVRRENQYCRVTRVAGGTPDGCKLVIKARNDSTFVLSKDLLEELVAAITQLLKQWYPDVAFSWTIPWTHPALAEDEAFPLNIDSVKAEIAKGLNREPTIHRSLIIREELLAPEFVTDYSAYFKTERTISGVKIESTDADTSNEQAASVRAASIAAALANGPDIDIRKSKSPAVAIYGSTPPAFTFTTPTTNSLHPSEHVILSTPSSTPSSSRPSSPPRVTIGESGRMNRSSSTPGLVDTTKKLEMEDGTFTRSREVNAASLNSLAMALSLLATDDRIAKIRCAVMDPPSIIITVPPIGTLNELIEHTYHSEPLSWPLRFRIAVDVAFAVQHVHRQVPMLAIHGLDAHSIFVKSNYRSSTSSEGIVELDMTSLYSEYWALSVFSPRNLQSNMNAAIAPSSNPLSNSSTNNNAANTRLSPQSADIFSLGAIFLQLWRNEPSSEFTTRVRGSLPPAPFFIPEMLGYAQFEQLVASCVCEDPALRPGIDQVLSRLSAIASTFKFTDIVQMINVTDIAQQWRKLKTIQLTSNSELFTSVSTLCQSTSYLTQSKPIALGYSKFQQMEEVIVWAGGPNGILYGLPFPTPAKSVPSSTSTSSPVPTTPQKEKGSLIVSTLPLSVLDNASIQYRLASFTPETRESRRRIISTVTTSKSIWCLLNSVSATILDPNLMAVTGNVEIGPCLSIGSYADIVYTGGTNGMITAWDGNSQTKITQREVAKCAVSSITANSRQVWVALSDDPGTPAVLLCLDARTLNTIGTVNHPSEETITAMKLTKVEDSQQDDHLWTGGLSGTIQTFLVHSSPFDRNEDFKVTAQLSCVAHQGRIQQFIEDLDTLYSSSEDCVVGWVPDASGVKSRLDCSTKDISCFTLLEHTAIITGHKNGSLTIWAAL